MVMTMESHYIVCRLDPSETNENLAKMYLESYHKISGRLVWVSDINKAKVYKYKKVAANRVELIKNDWRNASGNDIIITEPFQQFNDENVCKHCGGDQFFTTYDVVGNIDVYTINGNDLIHCEIIESDYARYHNKLCCLHCGLRKGNLNEFDKILESDRRDNEW